MPRPLMRGVPLFSLVLVLMLSGAFWWRVGRTSRRDAGASEPACDSTRAVNIAIDSLITVDHFKSKVYRFEHDSAGTQVVTIPNMPNTSSIVDGMAVIRIDGSCRITSLVRTDSA